MHHFIYQTTNTLDNKIYVGVHSTDDLNDGYLGSGLHLNRAIAKHGRIHFTRTILEQFDTAEAAYQRERELVNEEFVADPNTYNLSIGGKGGPKENSWSRVDPEAQREHARKAAAQGVLKRAPDHNARVSASVKRFMELNGSPLKGRIRTKIKCPHCNKEGAANVIRRWHFDNCKTHSELV